MPRNRKDAHFAVLGEQPVGLAQARRRTDLGRLLTAARREQRQLALALQIDEFGVEIARDDHQLVEPTQRFWWQIAGVTILRRWGPIGGDKLDRLYANGQWHVSRRRILSHTASFR